MLKKIFFKKISAAFSFIIIAIFAFIAGGILLQNVYSFTNPSAGPGPGTALGLLSSLIGKTTDTAGTATLFGRLGKSGDAAGSDTVFGKIAVVGGGGSGGGGIVAVSNPNNIGGSKSQTPGINYCTNSPFTITNYSLSDIELHTQGWLRISDASLSDIDSDGFKESTLVPANKLWLSAEGRLVESASNILLSRAGYKCAFVTSTPYSGDLGGLNIADILCQTKAGAFPGNYKAWLSDGITSAESRLTHSTLPYLMPNGIKIADDWADLVDGNIDNVFNIAENLNAINNYMVWTNTNYNGGIMGFSGNQTCQNWKSASPLDKSFYGWTSKTDTPWTSDADFPCSTFFYLYCIEQ